ncbi:PIN-like domain-containing protein [Streptomyces canus]|uniref:PIN-like domain-containing protein n=1 Tax=Streptomyces canus TaxID=58343 RepID=UPI000A924646|nr:PIN-like domain-containing protein [Streptomyces canus]
MSSYEANPTDGLPSRHLSLTDGFEYYLSASHADYERVLENGMVVLDTNAVLNLYRYTDEARTDLFSVLRRLGDRLWVPHQVAVEFWRNRESAASDLDFFGDAVIDELRDVHGQIERSLRTWANRVALKQEQLSGILEGLQPAFEGVFVKVQNIAGERSGGRSRNTFEDPVLLELQETLADRVGYPMEDEEYEKAIAEGLRRVDERIPPGYKDKKKSDVDAAGDYLVWAQTIKEAKLRRCEVLIITGDVKEDWWRRESGETKGPRLELAKEFHSAVGARVYMLRPPRFLELAREVLNVSVANESIDDASRVEHAIGERIYAASSVLASLRQDILRYVQSEPRLPLNDESIDIFGDFPAVAALFHGDSLVYLDFGRPIGRMLRRWRRKISGRKNICPEEVSFVVARLSENQMEDRHLLHSVIAEDLPAWHSNGFGNHDPGRLRAHAALPANHFDALYPIDLSCKMVGLAGADTVGKLLGLLRTELPYRVHVDLRLASEVADLPIEKSDLDGTVDSALRVLAAALPERWQITVMPGLITIGQSLKEVPGAQLVLRSQS